MSWSQRSAAARSPEIDRPRSQTQERRGTDGDFSGCLAACSVWYTMASTVSSSSAICCCQRAAESRKQSKCLPRVSPAQELAQVAETLCGEPSIALAPSLQSLDLQRRFVFRAGSRRAGTQRLPRPLLGLPSRILPQSTAPCGAQTENVFETLIHRRPDAAEAVVFVRIRDPWRFLRDVFYCSAFLHCGQRTRQPKGDVVPARDLEMVHVMG